MKSKKPKGMTLIQTHKAPVRELFNYFMTLHPKAIHGETYVYVPGSTRMPLLVAHADTVHRELPKIILLDDKKGILSSPQGLGADDRAGVYGILCLHASLDPKPGLLLCDKEETGGIGAYDASWGIADDLRPYPFMMELDRKGSGECVFYNDESEEFIKYIESFGFKEDYGIFSDVMFLGEGLRKTSVNLSIGFEEAHTLGEYLNLRSMNYTIKHAKRIMLNVLHTKPCKQISFKLPKPAMKSSQIYSFNSEDSREWNNFRTDGRDELRTRYKASRRPCDSPPPDVDEYMEDSFGSRDAWDRRNNPLRTFMGNKRICESCRSEEEVKYTDVTYGYLCAGCYQDWLENMREAEDATRKMRAGKPQGTTKFETPDYAKIRSGEQSWVKGAGVRAAVRALNGGKKEMIG